MSSSLIVVGQSWSSFTSTLTQSLSADFVALTVASFADTETFVSFKDAARCAGKHIILVYQFVHFDGHQRISADNGVNDQLIGVLQAIDILNQTQPSSLTVVMPYFPYARQEIAVDESSQGAVFMLGRCYQALGVNALAACDLHAPMIQRSYPVPLHHIQLTDFWYRVVRDHVLQGTPSDQLCIASPDEGGKERAKALASLLNAPLVVVHKKRVDHDVAVSYELIGDVHGKRVVILDDIIDTAHTAMGACDLLRSQGARAVYGCFTHAIFSQGARERLDQSNFEKILVSDSVLGLEFDGYKKIQTVTLTDYLVKMVSSWVRGL